MKYLLTGQKTERLDFKLLKAEEFNLWLPLFKAKDVALFLGMNQNFSQLELCQSWFDKVYNRYKNDLGGMNTLFDKKTKQLVGQCDLLIQTVEKEERLEIGFSILPEYWNNGYATEAAKKCKDFAFENNLANELISMVHVNNISSEKVAIKNGMTFEKRVKDFNIFRIESPVKA